MEALLNGRPGSGRLPQAEALQAVRIAEASGQPPMLVAYHPVANVNPYQALTYRRFAEAGIAVLPLYSREDASSLEFLRGFDVRVALHLHWISWVLNGAADEADAESRVDDAIEWLDGLKRSGIALIWSLHNAMPHDVVFVDAQIRVQQWLADNVDVIHVLNRSSTEYATHLTVPPEKVVHVSHPNYKGAYSDYLTREQARAVLGLDPDDVVYLMIGAIKAYKGLSKVLPALDGLEPVPSRRLLVAGKSDSHAESVQFVADCMRDARVLIDDRTVPESDMQIYLRAADITMLPYSRALNSGAALLALSFGLPIVTPAMGAFAEMLTPDCSELFDPDCAAGFQDALRRAERLITPDARRAASALADQFDADVLSRDLAGELRRRIAT